MPSLYAFEAECASREREARNAREEQLQGRVVELEAEVERLEQELRLADRVLIKNCHLCACDRCLSCPTFKHLVEAKKRLKAWRISCETGLV